VFLWIYVKTPVTTGFDVSELPMRQSRIIISLPLTLKEAKKHTWPELLIMK